MEEPPATLSSTRGRRVVVRPGYNQTYILRTCPEGGGGETRRDVLFRCGNWFALFHPLCSSFFYGGGIINEGYRTDLLFLYVFIPSINWNVSFMLATSAPLSCLLFLTIYSCYGLICSEGVMLERLISVTKKWACKMSLESFRPYKSSRTNYRICVMQLQCQRTVCSASPWHSCNNLAFTHPPPYPPLMSTTYLRWFRAPLASLHNGFASKTISPILLLLSSLPISYDVAEFIAEELGGDKVV
jgi:hypothetical protein